MICRHGGKMTHWFTSDRGDWEVRWCERCGALQKFNIFKNKLEWIFPQWIHNYKDLLKNKEIKNNKKSIKNSKKRKK